MSPVRVQMRRAKGWRLPKGTVYVGRPTRWGNPWRLDACLFGSSLSGWPLLAMTPPLAVELFRTAITQGALPRISEHLDELRGHDLACWCPLAQPCHADVLLELANRENGDSR